VGAPVVLAPRHGPRLSPGVTNKRTSRGARGGAHPGRGDRSGCRPGCRGAGGLGAGARSGGWASRLVGRPVAAARSRRLPLHGREAAVRSCGRVAASTGVPWSPSPGQRRVGPSSSPTILTGHQHQPSSPAIVTSHRHQPSSPAIVTGHRCRPSSPAIRHGTIIVGHHPQPSIIAAGPHRQPGPRRCRALIVTCPSSSPAPDRQQPLIVAGASSSPRRKPGSTVPAGARGGRMMPDEARR
jgi:hypothetical protein